ncbi:ATP-binding cassette domain-containing protein [Uliginosibacterium sp. 31-16]|uniref:ATP-binding cassette domain-containing protein n=1 Tax=Uliginosibacterium sp. 31-16 TaxID=3068315 RepID=UPI00273EC83E|nr:ATP-binding cassette domain-containing protein [Uliginosibacterium sp. 31-16]MDP5240812.1 ATP-binding cassette domain-containing protein [Uliginosibacterium sp. 31-16]
MNHNSRETEALASSAAIVNAKGTGLSLRSIVKRYGEREVLRSIDLDIQPGEFVAIVGRSGCGKSTLLRVIAGLEEIQSGVQLHDGRQESTHDDTRIMFQESRLLPWKKVLANVSLGLTRDRYLEVLDVLNEVGLADRRFDWPSRLSGGQRQRVALARALVHRPRLLLLDEPLGALDALTRIEMHALIESLWREHGFTALLVTHDVHEAIALADRVILIEDGQITQDLHVRLPRPRARSDAAFAALEELLLNQLLGKTLIKPDALAA